jgi:dTDP-4-amino-4,6-dideoxygalactose transaminase
MSIQKLAHNAASFRRPFLTFPSARSAFKAYLASLGLGPDERVLLPAYIGWSQREGSGVFDPVAELGLSHAFYRMTPELTIDLDHLRRMLAGGAVRVLVIIHYFGYVDDGLPEAVALAREHGALVLEDSAHALFTDLVGGAAGRLGDASLFSLHKMLPLQRGGMLLYNGEATPGCDAATAGGEAVPLPWEFDLRTIAERRTVNADLLDSLLACHEDLVTPLRRNRQSGEIPQTYPVLIRRGSRDALYQTMNDAGYGVVSLYHTLIDRITPEQFPESHRLARTVLNLPLHQDVEPDGLAAMVDRLVAEIRKLS